MRREQLRAIGAGVLIVVVIAVVTLVSFLSPVALGFWLGRITA